MKNYCKKCYEAKKAKMSARMDSDLPPVDPPERVVESMWPDDLGGPDRYGYYTVDVIVNRGSRSAKGQSRTKYKPDLKHICGASGYGLEPGDRCSRCDLDREAGDQARKILDDMEALDQKATQAEKDRKQAAKDNKGYGDRHLEL